MILLDPAKLANPTSNDEVLSVFLDYLMRPDVMAGIQNYVAYASGNQAALPLVDREVLDDPGVYPTPEAQKGLFTLAVLPPDVDRMFTRHWTTLKTGE